MELDMPTNPPLDVMVECGLAFFLILLGYFIPVSLSPVTVSVDTSYKSIDEFRNQPEFQVVGNRAKYFASRIKH